MSRERTTKLLRKARDGDETALSDLFAVVYEELRRVAGIHFRNQSPGHTLQPTALVHEVYLQLVGRSAEWRDRKHFLAIASKAMRNALVDHARRRRTQKRGGSRVRVPISTAEPSTKDMDVEVLDLDSALDELKKLDALMVRIIELRFFGGLTIKEAAQTIGVSPRKVEDDWYAARAWLQKRLSEKGRERG